MSAVRIIPCLDMREGRVVKGVNFVNIRDAGDPAETAAYYEREGASELAFLDINATYENRGTMADVVRKVVNSISIPLTVGGGIRTIDDMKALMEAGVSKVSINSAAVKNPKLISEAAKIFGSSRIIVAIDFKKNPEKNTWDLYLDGGRTKVDLDVVKWAKQACELGAGEILPTSMDKDGTKDGYDLEITRMIAEAVDAPVIASGGAGKPEDFKDAVIKGKASAVLAASLFHFREITIKDLKKYLESNGIEVV